MSGDGGCMIQVRRMTDDREGKKIYAAGDAASFLGGGRLRLFQELSRVPKGWQSMCIS